MHRTKNNSNPLHGFGYSFFWPDETYKIFRAFPRDANRLNALLIKRTHDLHSPNMMLHFRPDHNGAPIEFLNAMIWSREPASRAMTCSLVKAKTVCMSCS
jgi:hypothetical protein